MFLYTIDNCELSIVHIVKQQLQYALSVQLLTNDMIPASRITEEAYLTGHCHNLAYAEAICYHNR